ncbi:MAG: glycosyltransferase family 2 protein [Oscillospiraceae bacterium]|nr:glycosyltransferase family 2 protein [Oscillospiraceae bacterium]
MDVLYIIIPCYNEEKVLPLTAPSFTAKLQSLISEGKVAPESRILFVNDDSKDSTWDIIRSLSESEELCEGISLSRNRGHQNALLAGLTEASEKCDLTVTIDCDGQDDINAIDKMIDEYHAGCDIVYGVRNDRRTDSAFKRFTAQTYYKILARLGAEVVYNHADYRLISSRALRELLKYEEVNIYLRGMVPLVGFRSGTVEYVREERKAGETHYPLRKMADLAINGITGLTVSPMRIIMGCGVAVSALGFIWLAVLAVLAACGIRASLVWIAALVVFAAGVQLAATGVIGEYIGKIYLETKHRPRFVISERTADNERQ